MSYVPLISQSSRSPSLSSLPSSSSSHHVTSLPLPSSSTASSLRPSPSSNGQFYDMNPSSSAFRTAGLSLPSNALVDDDDNDIDNDTDNHPTASSHNHGRGRDSFSLPVTHSRAVNVSYHYTAPSSSTSLSSSSSSSSLSLPPSVQRLLPPSPILSASSSPLHSPMVPLSPSLLPSSQSSSPLPVTNGSPLSNHRKSYTHITSGNGNGSIMGATSNTRTDDHYYRGVPVLQTPVIATRTPITRPSTMAAMEIPFTMPSRMSSMNNDVNRFVGMARTTFPTLRGIIVKGSGQQWALKSPSFDARTDDIDVLFILDGEDSKLSTSSASIYKDSSLVRLQLQSLLIQYNEQRHKAPHTHTHYDNNNNSHSNNNNNNDSILDFCPLLITYDRLQACSMNHDIPLPVISIMGVTSLNAIATYQYRNGMVIWGESSIIHRLPFISLHQALIITAPLAMKAVTRLAALLSHHVGNDGHFSCASFIATHYDLFRRFAMVFYLTDYHMPAISSIAKHALPSSSSSSSSSSISNEYDNNGGHRAVAHHVCTFYPLFSAIGHHLQSIYTRGRANRTHRYQWTCTTCTLHNDAIHWICTICASPAPAPASSSPLSSLSASSPSPSSAPNVLSSSPSPSSSDSIITVLMMQQYLVSVNERCERVVASATSTT